MRKILIVLFAVQLFAAMILNLNVKESKTKVDLILNFDVPFDGKIAQKKEGDKIILYLKGVKILAPWQRKLDNPALYQIDVEPARNGSKVILYTAKKVRISALRSKDGFSLVISVKSPTATAHTPQKSRIEIKKYLIWALYLLAGLLLLWLLLKLLKGASKPAKTKRIVVENPKAAQFEIKFEKPLDERNKIALISFKGIDYLVLIGSSNILLGKYKEGEIMSEEDFHKAIDEQNFEEATRPKPQEEIFTTIEEYKRKASGNL